MKAKRPGRPGEALAAAVRERLRGMPPEQAVMMREVMRLHAAGNRSMAAHRLEQVAQQIPDHPEVLLWQGMRHMEDGAWSLAAGVLGRATEQRADDFNLWVMLASAQGRDNDADAARLSLGHAARCARSAAEWLKLSIECDRQAFYDEALEAVEAALRADPRSAVGLLQRSRCNKALGHAAAAAADCRTLIGAGRETARAWFALVDLKIVALSEAELARLESAATRADLPATDRQMLDFALGKSLEDAGQFERASEVFRRANDAVRAAHPWDASAFARRIRELHAAFDDREIAHGQPRGCEVIFIVGMPRSGSTLVEQVLAAHPDVAGASELPCLSQVIEAESRRRGRPFPAWASVATADDWTRLGQDYLRMSARWRMDKPIATDKLPDNWLFVGAIRAMLPEARIIDCRRDPLETCWSCYKQLFGPGLANFSYDFSSLAQYWHACEQMGNHWARHHPNRVRIQGYEALVADPHTEIRGLLDFCQLPFDSGCLDFQSAKRAIRTPSALQVRQPMRETSTPAASYGALIEPLRLALEGSNLMGMPDSTREA
jgi:tetratricopeptide (TPR) repeat protein